MKITAIESVVVKIPYRTGGPLASFGGRPWPTIDTLLVKVGTDQGIVGWGEAFGYDIIPATRAALHQVIAPLYLGRDPSQIEALMFEMQQKLHIFGRGGPTIYALSGIDIALWDIAGKLAGRPIHELLGGSGKVRAPAYASLVRYTETSLVEANAARAAAKGFRYVKLHEVGVEQTCAARQAIGPTVELMLDTNCPWSLQQAQRVVRQLEPFDLYWLEEPVWPPENFKALAELRATSGMHLAAGENLTSVMSFQQMFEAGAVDFAQPSPTKVGGISEARKVMTLANAHNVAVAPHTPYFGPGLLAGLQLNAACTGEVLVEWFYVDLETTLYGEAILPQAGAIRIPCGPGLGLEPDPAVIARYRVE